VDAGHVRRGTSWQDTPTDLPDRLSGEMPVQPHLQKYSASRFAQIKPISIVVPSHRGALAIVTDAGRDAVDAAALGTQCDRRAS